ncbi:class I SAM-dependent methyltransferase [Zemynaea arenosa]|nr:class I SAM-dependent methyltransferase [Massilia arenosa]
MNQAADRCVVCDGAMRAGMKPWHAVCTGCAYEQAALEPVINDPHAHANMDEAERETALRAIRQENFAEILQHLATLVAPGGRLLDVGCAHGWFLEAASNQYQVLGIEPDEAVAGRTSARGLPVRCGFFPNVLADDERFDVIVFNDVLEHIPDVRAAVDACHRHLNPNGVLVLNLPNSGGFFYRLSKVLARAGVAGPFERLWQKDLPSPHVHYFNPANLSRLIERHGFRSERAFQLPAIRANGLYERIHYVNRNRLTASVQYLGVAGTLPFLKLFPSDIVVGMYRKK